MDPFQEIKNLLANQTPREAMASAANYFLEQNDAHRLFEIRKMQGRHELGLPVVSWKPLPQLDAEIQTKLEKKLLAACHEAGSRLIASGDLAAAWNYLEPLEDRESVQRLMEMAEVTSENVDNIIEVTFHRGAHPAWGFQLLLKHFGTCNAITLLDSSAPYLAPAIKTKLVELLAQHFMNELVQNFANASQRPNVDEDAFATLISSNSEGIDWGAPLIDVTHLHSVTRLGRFAEDPRVWEQLVTLCRYGELLGEMFHFPGEPPFENQYTDSLLFFEGLLNRNRPQSIDHFLAKVEQGQDSPHSLLILETVIDWLARMQEVDQALELAIAYPRDDLGRLGIAPNLIELATRGSGLKAKLASTFEQRHDLLSFLMVQLIETPPISNKTDL
jgi:hypothetical protein